MFPAGPSGRIVILVAHGFGSFSAAWTIAMHSWSTTFNSELVRVITTNDPNIDFARLWAARVSAVGSRLMRPVMSWSQKNSSITSTAMLNSTLRTDRYPSLVMSTRVLTSKMFRTVSKRRRKTSPRPSPWLGRASRTGTIPTRRRPHQRFRRRPKYRADHRSPPQLLLTHAGWNGWVGSRRTGRRSRTSESA